MGFIKVPVRPIKVLQLVVHENWLPHIALNIEGHYASIVQFRLANAVIIVFNFHDLEIENKKNDCENKQKDPLLTYKVTY